MKSIGLIGLGNAGRPIGERLLKKGYGLKVYDLNPAAIEALVNLGAKPAGSAAEAAAEVTFTVLPSTVEVTAAVLGPGGVIEGIRPGSVLIDLSGTDPDCPRELEKKVSERGGAFLGGTLHADGAPAVTIPKGLLSVVVGGKRETFEACAEIFTALAEKVIYVPEPWIPKALKIAVIMLAVANSIISTEVVAWLLAQGIDPLLFLRTLQLTGSEPSAARLREFFRRNRSYGGTLSNIRKDLRQALETAAELKVPLPFSALANQIVAMSEAQGFDRITPAAAFGKLYETLSGISFASAVIDTGRTFREPKEPEVYRLDQKPMG